MKVDVLDALLASSALYVVGSYLFWVNKTIITFTANAVFGRFQRQGKEAAISVYDDAIREFEVEEEAARVFKEEEEAKLVTAATCAGH